MYVGRAIIVIVTMPVVMGTMIIIFALVHMVMMMFVVSCSSQALRRLTPKS